MPDPRMFTVTQCEPAYSKKSGASISNATNIRRQFFDSVGKIGDLEVLNGVDGGKIGKGLRNLANISNAIRTGQGLLPSTIGTTLDTGANWVLEQAGIAPTIIDSLRGFNPGVVNQAYGQAKNVFQTVKQGSFSSKDIPGVLQDFQNLERLGRHIFTPGSNDVQANISDRCEASPYAVDLIARAPKFKFLFVVQFIASDGYGKLSDQGYGPLDMAFTIKRSTRPTPKFTYQDVNYYNFRSKVITKTEFEEMSMAFHDDNQNFATQFYHAYTRAMIPITGVENPDSSMYEEGGMDFEGNVLKDNQILDQIPANVYSASNGILANDNKQIFREIRIYHLFDNGNRMNVWRFYNPRITSITLNDLDMSAGTEGSELALTFNYDTVFLDPDVSLADTKKYNIGQTQRGAFYPLQYNGESVGNIPPANVPVDLTGSAISLNRINTGTNQPTSNNSAVPATSQLDTMFSDPLSAFGLT